jgi:hypothetical protein
MQWKIRVAVLSGIQKVNMADKYEVWSVTTLKTELIKRGASTKGRKTDLIDR